ncbi:MAG: hypothetical protein KGL39_47015 [Patescibacteria group bacterium]|nr:hypothetical protein [Patescibacteria group bacterium]
MIYLSGSVQPAILGDANIGFILTPNMGNRPNLMHTFWGADTGCFSLKQEFQLDVYLDWLIHLQAYRSRCLFATAPDVARQPNGTLGGDPIATWKRSKHVLPVIRALGFPAALVAQNGIENTAIAWDSFDVLFIGGDTEWKLGEQARRVVSEAKANGKWVHLGRVNSQRRLRYAHDIGCDSADGTYIAYKPSEYVKTVRRWLRGLDEEAA